MKHVKLLQVYNQYRSPFSGEEAVVERTAALIEKHGGTARLLMRSSRNIGSSLTHKANAFWSGIYSRQAYREMERLLAADRPDVVHVHNLFPLFSPSILVACRRAGVPVVMSVHNQQLTCPRSDHLHRGSICDKCLDGSELHCVLRNCRDNIFESVGYALRSAFARKLRLFHKHVTLLIALSRFAKSRLVRAGFDERRIVVLPNMVELHEPPADPSQGSYIAFAGRMSSEKGVGTLLAAAAELPACRVRLAGSGPLLEQLRRAAPVNAELLGQLDPAQMRVLYRHARLAVVPSITYEMCPLVILEAFSHGVPVITSKLGAQRELIDEGLQGLLFEPGNARDLSHKMRQLWEQPALCRQMGAAGYRRVVAEHSEAVYYQRLIKIYQQAIAWGASGTRPIPRGPSASNVSEPVPHGASS